jgi:hypothetical protein
MKIVWRFITCIYLATATTTLAQETWQNALGRMPLGIPQSRTTELSRTNCVSLMLNAFQSNGVVKALIFMPGATDELYFFRRAHAILTNANPSLLDAVAALTNQTHIQATFQPPLMLLHTTEDALNGVAVVKSKSTAAKLRQTPVPGCVLFNDNDWDTVRALLKGKLSVGLRPFPNAPDSWHFYRHNFAACGVTEFQLLEAVALANKTIFTVRWLTADFCVDTRNGTAPKLEKFPIPQESPAGTR